MKRPIHFCITIMLLATSANLYSQTGWEWGLTQNGTQPYFQYGGSSCVDAAGNVYMTGQFTIPVLSVGAFSVTNCDTSNYRSDVFILKVDQWKNVLWMKSIGGSGDEYPGKLAIDGSGNLVVAGHYNSPTLYTEAGTLINTGSVDIYLLRIDPNGNFIHAETIGTPAFEFTPDIECDVAGNLYLTGITQAAGFSLGPDTIFNGAYEMVFLLKIRPDNSCAWLKKIAESVNTLRPNVLALDNFDHIYLFGESYAACTIFDSVMNGNSFDIFLVKMDTAGNNIWSRLMGGPEQETAKGLCTGQNGEIYLSGSFSSASFTLGGSTLYNTSGANVSGDSYIAQLDSNANAVWTRVIGGPMGESEYGGTICADGLGHLYVVGLFTSELYFAEDTLLPPGCINPNFLLKLTLNGLVVCSSAFNTHSASVTADNLGNAYVSGSYMYYPVPFGSDVLWWYGGMRFYLAKYNCTPTAEVSDLNGSAGIVVAPNPSPGIFTLVSNEGEKQIRILNMEGRVVREFMSTQSQIGVDLSDQPAGIYLMQVQAAEQWQSARIVVDR